MTIDKLLEEVKQRNNNLKGKNIIEYFPTIVDDIKFFITDYEQSLENTDEILYRDTLMELQKNRLDYFALLITQYMKLKWKKEFKYEIDDNILFQASGGYNKNKDLIQVSVIGTILNNKTTLDNLTTIFHETRHSLQHKFLKEKDMEEILKYPSNFITIIQSMIPAELCIGKENLTEDNWYYGDRIYYHENYKRIYEEVDANYYGIEESKRFLCELYALYPDKTDKKLENRLLKVQRKLKKQGIKAKNDLIEESKLDSIYIEEINTCNPITSKIKYNNEEIDALLFINKVIKENILTLDEYPVLGLIINNYRLKTYEEVLQDKEMYLQEYPKYSKKINSIYCHIIKSNPILLISKYITENNIDKINQFILSHPTFIDEYQEELKELNITNQGIKKLLIRNPKIYSINKKSQ